MFSTMYSLDLFGVAMFAITGALLAEAKQLNILGVLLSAILTAVGGGTVRDLILGQTPVFWIQNPVYLIVATIAGFSVFLVAPYYRFQGRVFFLADAASLAIFTIIGIQKAISLEVPLFNAVLLGTLTGVGGGVMRDLLLGHRLPLLFQQELYATAAFLGGWIYLLVYLTSLSEFLALFSSILVVVFIRLAAKHWRLKLPVFRIRETPRKLYY